MAKGLSNGVLVLVVFLILLPQLTSAQGNGPASPADPFAEKSVWVNEEMKATLTVIERKGESFRAKLLIGDTIERDIAGAVKGRKVTWLGKDVKAIKGGQGGDNYGTISSDKIDFEYPRTDGTTGKFTLHRSEPRAPKGVVTKSSPSRSEPVQKSAQRSNRSAQQPLSLPPGVTVKAPVIYEITMTTTLSVPPEKRSLVELRVFHGLPALRPWSKVAGPIGAADLKWSAGGVQQYEREHDSYYLLWRGTGPWRHGTKLEFRSQFTVRSVHREFMPSQVKVQWKDYDDPSNPVGKSVPEVIHPTITQAADKIKAASGPTQAVVEFCKWISTTLKYDASVSYEADDIANILKNRRGHCGHWYSVFEQLCHQCGIPVRMAYGPYLYAPDGHGELDAVKPDYTNVHTWAEVYFPGVGWIEVEPSNADKAYAIPANFINGGWVGTYSIWMTENGQDKVPAWNYKNGKYISELGVEHRITYVSHSESAAEAAGSKAKAAEKSVPRSPPRAAVVPSDAASFNGHSYKFFAEQLSWKESKAKCTSAGGHLVVIDSAEENKFVAELVAKAGSVDTWIGVTDEAQEGTWLTVEGKPLAYRNWLPGQPNNKANEEHYGLLSNRSFSSGKPLGWTWCDQPNQSKEHHPGYVCEWDKVAPTAAKGSTPPRSGSSAPASAGQSGKTNSRVASGPDFLLTMRISGQRPESIQQVRPALDRLDKLLANPNQATRFEATVKVLQKEKTFESPKAARKGVETMLLAAADEVCRQYGVTIISSEVRTLSEGSYWQTKPPKQDDVLVFGLDVVRFLSGYSVQAIQRCGLKHVVVCEDAAQDGRPSKGAGYGSGSGEASQDTILLNIKDAQQGSASGLHHELYHVFDQSRSLALGIATDAEWTALNPPGFVYRGYAPFLGPAEQTLKVYAEPAPDGFISAYAAASEWEDKAETYSCMMLEPKRVERAIVNNQNLRAKVDLIERRMRLLGPEYVPGFWKSKQP